MPVGREQMSTPENSLLARCIFSHRSSAVSDSHSSPESRAASDGNSCLVRTHMRTRNSSRTHDSNAVTPKLVCPPTEGIQNTPTSTQPGTQADGEGTAV